MEDIQNQIDTANQLPHLANHQHFQSPFQQQTHYASLSSIGHDLRQMEQVVNNLHQPLDAEGKINYFIII
jgi:hypothetical protein